MNAIVSTAALEQLIAYRDASLAALYEAFDIFEIAAQKMDEGLELWKAAAPNQPPRYYNSSHETEAFIQSFKLPEKKLYIATARRMLDTDVWKHVVSVTGIESLMDTQAREEFSEQMAYQPPRVNRAGEIIDEDEANRGLPPATVDNIMSTLQKFQSEADHIFRRSLAKVFSSLDRSFRSHDGFKFGNRIIFKHAFDDWSWRSESRRNQLIDVERALLLLDGKDPRADYGSIINRIHLERRRRAEQTEHESDYFKIRIFKNGNAHLWFTRKDLLLKVNQILAEWYGETVGDGQQQEEDPFENKKITPAKNFGFYPTPDDVAERVNYHMKTFRKINEPELRILEPSAGTGNLARRFAEHKNCHFYPNGSRQEYLVKPQVDCVEIQPGLAEKLQAEGIYNHVTAADFLSLTPDNTRLYDYIGMNPPFDQERDVDHVMHALSFLKPGGTLVSVMSAGTEFRQTKKSIAFRGLMQKWQAGWHDLPFGSFAESGTNVNTLILVVRKPDNQS